MVRVKHTCVVITTNEHKTIRDLGNEENQTMDYMYL